MLLFVARLGAPAVAPACALVAALALTVCPRVVRAQDAAPAAPASPPPDGPLPPPLGLELAWDAPPGCPDRAALLTEIARLLGRPRAPTDPPMRARGAITRRDGAAGYRLEVETTATTTTGGQRGLDDRSCQHLADAAALVIALALDATTSPAASTTASSAASAASASQQPAVTPVPVPVPVPVPTPRPQPLRRPARPNPPTPRPLVVHAGFRITTGLDVGALPAPTPTLGLLGVLGFGPLRIEFGGTYAFAQTARDRVATGVGAEVWMAAGGVRVCYAFELGPGRRFAVGPCLGAEAGVQYGRGVGNSVPSAGSAPWAAAQGAGLLEWRVAGPFVLRLDAGVVVPFVAPAFQINDQTAFRAAPAGFRGAVGVGLHFP